MNTSISNTIDNYAIISWFVDYLRPFIGKELILDEAIESLRDYYIFVMDGQHPTIKELYQLSECALQILSSES